MVFTEHPVKACEDWVLWLAWIWSALILWVCWNNDTNVAVSSLGKHSKLWDFFFFSRFLEIAQHSWWECSQQCWFSLWLSNAGLLIWHLSTLPFSNEPREIVHSSQSSRRLMLADEHKSTSFLKLITAFFVPMR